MFGPPFMLFYTIASALWLARKNAIDHGIVNAAACIMLFPVGSLISVAWIITYETIDKAF